MNYCFELTVLLCIKQYKAESYSMNSCGVPCDGPHSCSYACALHRKPLEMWDVTADCQMSFSHHDKDIRQLIWCVICSESAEITQRHLSLSFYFTSFRHKAQTQSCATSSGRRSPSLRRARERSFPWSRPWRSTRPPWRTAWPQSDCSSSEDKLTSGQIQNKKNNNQTPRCILLSPNWWV